MITRIGLRTGGAILVEGSIDDVKQQLDTGDVVIFNPIAAVNADVETVDPEPLAVRIDHVADLANASA